MIADKLSIINAALADTQDNPVAVADDGSDEWNCASPAYDRAVELALEAGNWSFDTAIANPLVRVGASPDDLFNDAMAMPQNALHLIWVRVNDQPADYRVIGNQICLNLDNFVATAKYVVDSQATGAWPPSFQEVILLRVRAALYRGLHEDLVSAQADDKEAMLALTLARTRDAQQNPKRRTFNSRARAARIVRRPWVTTPFDWGGTGVPD